MKVLEYADEGARNVAKTCRHFGISRQAFYRWKRRVKEHGAAGLCDRRRTPQRSPRATSRDIVSKILYLPQNYHFGPWKIADYVKRFHGVRRSVVRASDSAETRDEPTAGQPEVPTARETVDALRKAQTGAPPPDGCQISGARSRYAQAPLSVHGDRRLHAHPGPQSVRCVQSDDAHSICR
jgi:hypothetical protein